MVSRKELVEADIDDMTDLEKEILKYMHSIPKPKHENILENFRNKIDWEDLSDVLRGWNDDGILYKNYGHYCFTEYGEELVSKLKQPIKKV